LTGAVRLGEEVAAAVAAGRATVAIETSVIGQGLPVPRNVEAAERMSSAVRAAGAVPAWVGLLDGDVVVGLTEDELAVFAEPGRAEKVARRDLPRACARGGPGATTVSATIWGAARAGIRVSATGGIGGVHLGDPRDVSGDLIELARTPGLLVCSGPKSIVDVEATVERLESLGVALLGHRTRRLPSFLASEAPIDVEPVDGPVAAARVLAAALELGTRSTILLCNPVPEELALDPDEIAAATRRAEARASGAGVRGRDLTPFLLNALAEETAGRSLDANLGLLEANAGLAAQVAVASAG
jgi:pseudouridine-5'-phosphate glycosidase